MFFQFSGLLLIVHFIIIGIAFIVNFIKGEKLGSAFQTYDKSGGMVKSLMLNRLIALLILIAVTSYLVSLLYFVVTSGIETGASEPQVIYAKSMFAFILAGGVAMIMDPMFQILTVSGLLVLVLGFLYLNRLIILNKVNMSKNNNFTVEGKEVASNMRSQLTKISSLIFGVIAGVALFSSPLWAQAQIVEPGFESETVVADLSLATAVAFAPDGRIFVAEKSGVVKVVKNDVLLDEPLLTLTDINTFGDRGLLGIAVDPDFANNSYIYLSYTYENTPGASVAGPKTGRIVRMTVVGDTADESTKVVLVGTVGGSASAPSCDDFAVTADCIPSDSGSHSVGGLRFGPDGMLYATLGDGADFSAVDPRALRAQNVDSLAGKVLRINKDGSAPTDNPFYDGTNSNRSKVYALGVRNMFRINFNPVSGKLYGGDVGWSDWEEINEITAGANYGWPCREGNGANVEYDCTPSSPTTDPVYTYPHNSSGAGSITGGAFFSSSAYPTEYQNTMLIGDYAQMWMKMLVLDSAGNFVAVEDFINGNTWPVEIINGPDGNTYYLDIVMGSLIRVTHTDGNRSPVVQISASPTSGLAPLTVDFSSAGTVDPDGDALTYEWDFADGNVSNEANPTHTYTTNGSYFASLTATDVHGASKAKNLNITVGDQAPTANITSPASGSLYKASENVTVIGDGNDPEDGVLPASAFEWEVLLHHNTHVHNVQQFSGTKEIEFVADDHNDSDVYMEIILTVTDSAGLTSSKSINMYLDNGIGSGNLISNPSLETEGSIAGFPLDWSADWYGVMNPNFTYPVAGFEGDRAGKVEVLSYESGSAKWAFSPVFVTSGEEYVFKNKYTSTVGTDVTARFIRPDGTSLYQYLGFAPASEAVAENNMTFAVPEGIETVSIFHEIYAVGELTVDDYSLTLASDGDVTPPTGTISNVTANQVVSGVLRVEVDATDDVAMASVDLEVDGNGVGVGDSEPPYSVSWDTTSVADGTYTLVANMHDTSGNTGETPGVTVTVNNSGSTTTPTTGNNLVTNGNFETAGPANWNQGGWGTNNAVFTYPATGNTGNGAKVEITSFTSGDAKWYFSDVNVEGNTEYALSNNFNSNLPTEVLVRYTLDDSSLQYVFVEALPSTGGVWQAFSNTITTPANAVSMTMFHVISAVGELTIDDVSVTDPSGTGTTTPDTTAPTVAITSPTEGQEVSGTVTVDVDATDDVAVQNVKLLVDGSEILTDTTSPYSFAWDTTGIANGSYAISAEAVDTSNNQATSSVVNVIVNNTASTTTPPTGNNLVTNGNFETAGPANWNQGGWGTNDRVFTYPATGNTGNGAKVEITSYTSGDAKWYFSDVNVTGDTTYTISDNYNSNVTSDVLVRYTLTDATNQYVFVQSLPSTGGTWESFSQNVTTPATAESMTMFHLIAGVGELTIDDVSVVDPNATGTEPEPEPEEDTVDPTVSISSPSDGNTVNSNVTIEVNANDNIAVAGVRLLIDGNQVLSEDTTAPYSFTWNSATVSNGAHTISAEARDEAGNTAIASEITVTVDNSTTPTPSGENLIENGDFEIAGTDGNPQGWTPASWGNHTAEFNYPITGADGGSAAEIVITDYPVGGTGDAKWAHPPVAVTPGTQYTYTTKYRAGTISDVIGRYEFADGSEHYFGVIKEILPTNDWTEISGSFVPPENTVQVTLYHLISTETFLTIDDVSLFVTGTGTPAETNVPIVEFVNPLDGDTISGNVTLTASSSDDTGVVGVFFAVNGSPVGTEDTTSPYQYTWDTTTVADGDYILKATTRDPYGNNDKVEITVTVDNSGSTPPPADTEDPVVSISSPSEGDTVSDTVSIDVSATDNVAVENVRLLIDGVQVGSLDTTTPYAFEWDSTTVANGTHTIRAEAQDEAGNVGVSTEITVTVDNTTSTPPPTGDNLVTNGDFETAGPANWNQGGWGTNDAVFTYPASGNTGNGAMVAITNYVDGDAKWYFDDVSVSAETSYNVSDSYNSTVGTQVIARYTMSDGSAQYVLIESLPATGGSWETFSENFVTPVGATSVTIFHVIADNGELTIDDMSVQSI